MEFVASDEKKKRGVVLYVNKILEPKCIFCDFEGRYIAVEVSLNYKKSLVVGIYAPNGPKEFFFANLKGKFQGLHYKQMSVLGDFNRVMDAKLDRIYFNKKKAVGKVLKTGLELMAQEDLVDVWRIWNKNKKECFFSQCQK